MSYASVINYLTFIVYWRVATTVWPINTPQSQEKYSLSGPNELFLEHKFHEHLHGSHICMPQPGERQVTLWAKNRKESPVLRPGFHESVPQLFQFGSTAIFPFFRLLFSRTEISRRGKRSHIERKREPDDGGKNIIIARNGRSHKSNRGKHGNIGVEHFWNILGTTEQRVR